MAATDKRTHTDVSFHWINFAAYLGEVCVCVCMCVCVCVCVCVCMCVTASNHSVSSSTVGCCLLHLSGSVLLLFQFPSSVSEFVLPFLNDFISTGKKLVQFLLYLVFCRCGNVFLFV
jgi:hypothetical protein